MTEWRSHPSPPGAAASWPPERSFGDIPFGEILTPFCAFAREQVRCRSGAPYRLLDDAAHQSLARSLAEFLAAISGQALELEFSQFRAGRPLESLATSSLFSRFTAWFAGDVAAFRVYPVLSELIRLAVALWVDSTAEFLGRLGDDKASLEREFGVRFPVTEAAGALSDRHEGGRSVILVTFASGHQIVYKPKDLGTERLFYSLLHWINDHGPSLRFEVPSVLVRRQYGWAQAIETRPCSDPAALERYYRRAGMLVALVYALNGSDCHFDNLIAAGEHPVLVDAEMLFQPGSEERWWNSVFRTGLISVPHLDPEYEISALGATSFRPVRFRIPVWRNINTDDMSLRFEPALFCPRQNVPVMNGHPVAAAEYAGSIVEGFRHMYQTLFEARRDLSDAAGPLAGAEGLRVRTLMRGTLDYMLLLSRSLQPEYLRDHSARERLFREAGVTSAERDALERLDIPRFAVPAAFGALQASLRRLNEDDMARQAALLRVALLRKA